MTPAALTPVPATPTPAATGSTSDALLPSAATPAASTDSDSSGSHASAAAPTRPVELAVLIGSVRAGRLSPTVAAWFTDLASGREDVVLDVIDPAATTATSDASGLGGQPGPQEAAVHQDISRRLHAADGFIVITPEYNHSFPAALKHLLDSYRQEWFAKPVGFVSYGGISGGLRAVEHLRGVFAELHAVGVRDSVSLHSAQAADFAPDGRIVNDPQAAAAVTRLLDQVSWWGRALRTAREVEPYAA